MMIDGYTAECIGGRSMMIDGYTAECMARERNDTASSFGIAFEPRSRDLINPSNKERENQMRTPINNALDSECTLEPKVPHIKDILDDIDNLLLEIHTLAVSINSELLAPNHILPAIDDSKKQDSSGSMFEQIMGQMLMLRDTRNILEHTRESLC